MVRARPRPSVHDLSPLECGGVDARIGFALQDHVAVGFCLEMLATPSLRQVWCENQDDITLIWQNDNAELVEFVQVKSNEPDQLWSVAMLCRREKTATKVSGAGTSIVERSLANDRCNEPCRFRIVTARPVNGDLKILTLPLDSPHRKPSAAAIRSLETKLARLLGTCCSPNNNTFNMWLSVTVWDVRHCEENVHKDNLIKLQKLLESDGTWLFSDQVAELAAQLLVRVETAAKARWETSASEKKIERNELMAWLRRAAGTLEHPGFPESGKTLRAKMEHASIPADAINAAIELRRHYRQALLTPKYVGSDDRRRIESSVSATLQRLRAQLDAGQLKDSGVTFHSLCLDELANLPASLILDGSSDLAFIYGCMYNMADRCAHRFRRATG